jgi:hypothetical protein
MNAEGSSVVFVSCDDSYAEITNLKPITRNQLHDTENVEKSPNN